MLLDRQLARRSVLALGCLAASAAFPRLSFGRSWPDRTIKMIVPYPAGGAPDIIVRLLNAHLGPQLGVPLIVDNKPGGATIIAAVAAAQAESDGYTLLIASTSTLCLVPTLYGSRAHFDPIADFSPISLVSRAPFFFMTSKASPYRDLPTLIAAAKATPGKISYGSNAIGGASHVNMLLFQKAAGIEMLHVPYKSMTTATNDLLGGQIDVVLGDLSTVTGLVEAKEINLLAAASAQRSPLAPSVPTAAEISGVDVGEAGPWFGIFGPRNLPSDIVQRLNASISDFVNSPSARQTYEKVAQIPLSSSPAELANLVRDDLNRFAVTIREQKIAIE